LQVKSGDKHLKIQKAIHHHSHCGCVSTEDRPAEEKAKSKLFAV